MAKKKQKRSVHAEYPWAKWFSRKSFSLFQGDEYVCAIHGMASQIRTKASKLGLRVSLRIDGSTIHVTNKGKIR